MIPLSKVMSLGVLCAFFSTATYGSLYQTGSIHDQDGWHVSHTNFDQVIVEGVSDTGVAPDGVPGALRISSKNGGNIPGGPMSAAFSTRVGTGVGMNDRFLASFTFRPVSSVAEESSFDVGFATRDNDVIGGNGRLSHSGVGVNDRLSVLRVVNLNDGNLGFFIASPDGSGAFVPLGQALVLPADSSQWWSIQLEMVVDNGEERWSASLFAGATQYDLSLEIDSVETTEFRTFNDWTDGRPDGEGTVSYAGANAVLFRAGPSDGDVEGFYVDNLELSTFLDGELQEFYATDFSVIPEPAAVAVLFGVGAILIALRRRQSRA